MKVSILIPIKNEPFINQLIKEIHKTLSKYKYEIIIIDKSDIKPKILTAKIISQKSNGLGNAILEGFKYTTGDVIITMDGDGSHDPKDIEKFIQKIKNYDIIIGSRFVSGAKTEDSTHRKIISFLYRQLACFILDLKIKDPMSGFSAIKKTVYNKLKLNPRGYKINTEILYKAKKLNFKSTEVPITFHKRMAGKPTPKFKEAFRTLIFMFELKLGIR